MLLAVRAVTASSAITATIVIGSRALTSKSIVSIAFAAISAITSPTITPPKHEPHAPADHTAEDVAPKSAQRQPHADLRRLLGDEIREHAVDPDERKHHRQQRERRDEHGPETWICERLVNTSSIVEKRIGTPGFSFRDASRIDPVSAPGSSDVCVSSVSREPGPGC